MSSERGEVWIERHTYVFTGRLPREGEGRNRGGDASIHQGTLKMARSPPEPGEMREQTLPHRPQKESTSLVP